MTLELLHMTAAAATADTLDLASAAQTAAVVVPALTAAVTVAVALRKTARLRQQVDAVSRLLETETSPSRRATLVSVHRLVAGQLLARQLTSPWRVPIFFGLVVACGSLTFAYGLAAGDYVTTSALPRTLSGLVRETIGVDEPGVTYLDVFYLVFLIGFLVRAYSGLASVLVDRARVVHDYYNDRPVTTPRTGVLGYSPSIRLGAFLDVYLPMIRRPLRQRPPSGARAMYILVAVAPPTFFTAAPFVAGYGWGIRVLEVGDDGYAFGYAGLQLMLLGLVIPLALTTVSASGVWLLMRHYDKNTALRHPPMTWSQ